MKNWIAAALAAAVIACAGVAACTQRIATLTRLSVQLPASSPPAVSPEALNSLNTVNP